MFLSERDSPARIHFLLGPLDDRDQTALIGALDEQQVNLLLLDNHFDDADLLWQYVDDKYVQDTTVHGLRAFLRSPR